MKKIPIRELLDWGSLIQEEQREHKPEHWYMAQIALYLHYIHFEIQHMWDKKPAERPRLKVKNLLVDYRGPDEEAEVLEIDTTEDESWRGRAEFSKAVWLGFAGLNRDGKPYGQATAVSPPANVRPPPKGQPTADQLPDPAFAAQMTALAATKQSPEG